MTSDPSYIVLIGFVGFLIVAIWKDRKNKAERAQREREAPPQPADQASPQQIVIANKSTGTNILLIILIVLVAVGLFSCAFGTWTITPA